MPSFLARGLRFDQAAREGIYRLRWAGDGSSMLVALQMPVSENDWDLSDLSSGRLTPTARELFDVAEQLAPADRGGFLAFSWSNLLKDPPIDQPGPVVPRTLAGATAVTLCTDLDGEPLFLERGEGSYGDYFDFPFLPYANFNADPYGYLRQYDLGSCSANVPFRPLMEAIVDTARDQVPTSLDIRSLSVAIAFAPVLRQPPGSPPGTTGDPLRQVGDDTLELRVRGNGRARRGAGVCSFTLSLDASYRLVVDPNAPVFTDRLRLERTEPADTDVHASNCSTNIPLPPPFNSLADLIAEWLANEALSSMRIRSGLAQIEGAFDDANFFLSLPIPDPDILPVDPFDPDASLQVAETGQLFDEIRHSDVWSDALLLRAAGPEGTCVASDLKALNNAACSEAVALDPLLDRLAASPLPQYRDLGSALFRLAAATDHPLTECRPMRGAGDFARVTYAQPRFNSNLHTWYSLASQVGVCPSGFVVPRLFRWQGGLAMGCVRDETSDSKCHACYVEQDGGDNCDLEYMLARDARKPSLQQCLVGINEMTARYDRMLWIGRVKKAVYPSV